MHHLIVSARKELCFDQVEDTPSVAGSHSNPRVHLTSRPSSFGSSAKGEITPRRRPIGAARGSRGRRTSFGSDSLTPPKALCFEETPATPANDSVQEETLLHESILTSEISIQEHEDEDAEDEEADACARSIQLVASSVYGWDDCCSPACTPQQWRRSLHRAGRGSPWSAGAAAACRTPCSAAGRAPCSEDSQVRRRHIVRARRLSLGGACCVRPGGSEHR